MRLPGRALERGCGGERPGAPRAELAAARLPLPSFPEHCWTGNGMLGCLELRSPPGFTPRLRAQGLGVSLLTHSKALAAGQLPGTGMPWLMVPWLMVPWVMVPWLMPWLPCGHRDSSLCDGGVCLSLPSRRRGSVCWAVSKQAEHTPVCCLCSSSLTYRHFDAVVEMGGYFPQGSHFCCIHYCPLLPWVRHWF